MKIPSKTILIAVLIALVSIAKASAGSDNKTDILNFAPFYKGSIWTYNTSQGLTETLKVKGYRNIAGIKAVILESSLSGPVNMVLTKDKLLRFKAIAASGSQILYSNGFVLLDMPLIPGKTWHSNLGGKAAFVEIIGKETVTTPAGEFKNATKIGVKHGGSPLYEAILWLAENTGVVQTLENHLFKTLVSFEPTAPDPSIINTITSNKLLSKLTIADTDEGLKIAKQTTRTGDFSLLQALSEMVTPTNLFIGSTFIILAIFILILVKISGFLRVEVDSLAKQSKRHLAQTYLGIGDFQRAEKILRQSLTNQPFADTFNALGIALEGQKKFAEAADVYKKALGINPKYKEAKINLARSLFSIQRFDETLDLLKSLIKENPTYADLHNLIAETYMARNQNELAREHLQKAISINPSYAKAQANLEKLRNLSQGENND